MSFEPTLGADNAESALFVDDHGKLPLESRRALVHLLSGPFIDGRRHPKLWAALLQDEGALRQRLSELFMELMVDPDGQVAFTRRADTGDLQVPVLLRRMQLTFMDSVLVLLLRQALMRATARGERAVISWAEIEDLVSAYRPSDDGDEAKFVKRVRASVERLKDRSLLQKVRADDNRFEISPTLRLLFDPEQVQQLTGLYQAMEAGEGAHAHVQADEQARAGEEERVLEGEEA